MTGFHGRNPATFSDRSKFHKFWIVFFAGWIVILSGLIPFGSGSAGFRQWFLLNAMLDDRKAEITKIETRIDGQQRLIQTLQTKDFAQEQEVRRTLGYVQDTEIIFEFQGRE